ncbi:hypothetical protein [Arenibaculum sp.]|jgi:hypothetical protein|uniref:hypothetical protein n=1 Tax=Arenibaculum sp. TaxID=2865862 RepID=UPI002E1409CE|nr:hypothetical protein [Arenibaculum sp.]
MQKTIYREERRTCFTYSVGGHYAELTRAIQGIEFVDSYHVTWWSPRFDDGVERYFVTHPRKSVLRTLANAAQSFLILVRKRPKVIVSTGADVAISTVILGKLLFRAKVIFVESCGQVRPTLTGRIAYPFSDLFIVQWKEQQTYYPKSICAEGLLL